MLKFYFVASTMLKLGTQMASTIVIGINSNRFHKFWWLYECPILPHHVEELFKILKLSSLDHLIRSPNKKVTPFEKITWAGLEMGTKRVGRPRANLNGPQTWSKSSLLNKKPKESSVNPRSQNWTLGDPAQGRANQPEAQPESTSTTCRRNIVRSHPTCWLKEWGRRARSEEGRRGSKI